MNYLVVSLMCLLGCEAAYFRINKRGHSYSIREAPSSGGEGYQYQAPVGSGSLGHGGLTMATFGGSSSGSSSSVGGGGGDGGYHYDAPASTAAAAVDLQGLSGVVESTLGSSDGHSGSLGGSSSSLSSGSSSFGGGSGFNFGGYTGSSNFGSAGISDGGKTSGSSDQFTGFQGELINEHPPSIFNYKPEFGGKDINNLPHILPPGGKSIHELQEEADAKLRAIVAKAKMNQMEAVERISKLKTNYGYGTLGFDGFKDTRFKQKGNFDLGTHKAIDLGTSIDYNALKTADGKLKLPIQNVYHTKTLGIHVPQPYPVKHEVAVPAPFPVPHPVPVPHHRPTAYTPLNNEEVLQLTDVEGKGGPYGGHSFGGGNYEGGSSLGGGFGNFGGGNYKGSSSLGGGFGNFDGGNYKGSSSLGGGFGNFGGSFSFDGAGNSGGSSTFKGVSTGSYSIEPSQSISETSSVGGPEYGAGTPNAGGAPISSNSADFSTQDQQQQFGISSDSTSAQLGSYDGRGQVQQEHSGNAGSHDQTINSEVGSVSIPSMSFGERTRPRPEYGPPH